ncbi:MAG: FKBP-type peptidyl-prolyl cis-trans isomerase [Thalassotalea sp.]
MNFLKPTLVAVALVSVFGCQEAKQEAVTEDKPLVLETDTQKQSYGLGTSIGSYMKANLEKQTELGMALDQELILKGFADQLAGKAQMTEEEAKTALMAMETALKEKQQAVAEEQAKSSLADGQKFLADNAKKDGVKVTESGIQYSVMTEGEGDKPAATDTVTVHYKGTFLSGETFDSSYDRGQPAVFPLNRVIAGWTEGVQLMSVGAKYKFTIPSDLAYGPNGNPPRIPGNSVLQFEIELLEIQKAEEPAKVGDATAAK